MPASRPRRSGRPCGGPSSCRRSTGDHLADRGPHDLQAVQRHTVRVLVTSQAVGALGMTIGFATASLLARDISGSDTQAGLVQTCQVLGRGRGVVRPGPLDVAPWTSGRTRHGLPRRRHGERARRGGRGGGVDGTAPDRRIAAGSDVGGQPQQPVRRHRPRPGELSGPRPLDRGLGLDDRSRRSAPTSPVWAPGPPSSCRCPSSPVRSPSVPSPSSSLRSCCSSHSVRIRCWSPGRRPTSPWSCIPRGAGPSS